MRHLLSCVWLKRCEITRPIKLNECAVSFETDTVQKMTSNNNRISMPAQWTEARSLCIVLKNGKLQRGLVTNHLDFKQIHRYCRAAGTPLSLIFFSTKLTLLWSYDCGSDHEYQICHTVCMITWYTRCHSSTSPVGTTVW